MNAERVKEFQETVLGYYREQGRHDLPWRRIEADGTVNPYHVLVSELMLQQTQVQRVLPKFTSFTAQFPTFAALADAPLAAVLQVWVGLGYNRRAKFLWHAAQAVHARGDVLPDTTAELITLPGVGSNTAGALLAYAYNKPVVFVETNIRTVFIHHFFRDKEGIRDVEILDLVARTLPDNPRVWYWGLMDYGTYLKQTIGNPNAASKHYKRQSPFAGSRRQIRGQVLKRLAVGPATLAALQRDIGDERLEGVLDELTREGLLAQAGNRYMLYGA